MENTTNPHPCTQDSGRFFENMEGKVYESCKNHLFIYLKYYRGGPEKGGWKEIKL
jgi:hypothetical protein